MNALAPSPQPPAPRRELAVRRLGVVPYDDALTLQRALVEQRKAGEIPDTLLLLQHPHVLTLGVRGDGGRGHILASDARLAELGVAVSETGRGGDVTYHGPGQLVGYPIIDLDPDRRDVHRYVRDLEEVMIRLCASYGVPAGRLPGKTGTWVRVPPDLGGTTPAARDPGGGQAAVVDEGAAIAQATLVEEALADPAAHSGRNARVARAVRADQPVGREAVGVDRAARHVRGGRANAPEKIGAIGVRISRWVTSHGFAFNVWTDLEFFRLIVPCGIAEYGVTSLKSEIGAEIAMRDVEARIVQLFGDVFDRRATTIDPSPP